jgi:hypothetical protein
MAKPNYSNFSTWQPGDIASDLFAAFGVRETEIQRIQYDLAAFAISQGYTANQTRSAIEALFRTFVTQWFLYIVCGADDIVTAIQNDATLPWLNTQVGGQTIRQRLINRLS